jgi:ABC-type phosphate/phosphonate transport system substrate-binding protein
MIASLPMYDLPELRSATDDLWNDLQAALRDEGVRDVPDRLTRDRPLEEVWSDPDLLLGQTCGYPLTHALRGRTTVVATPRYSAPGCTGSSYCSFLVVHARSDFATVADLHGRSCAINERTSHSGMNALRATVAPFSAQGRFFSSVRITGEHAASLALIAQREADVAAIDCVTHALLSRARPDLVAATRILRQTQSAPSLPLITNRPHELRRLRAALARVLPRVELLLEGFELLPESAYDIILEMECSAASFGLSEL